MSRTLALEEFPTLAGLPSPDVQAIGLALERHEVGAGHRLFDEGDPADGLWLVARGCVRVRSRAAGEAGAFGPGAMLGALSLVGSFGATELRLALLLVPGTLGGFALSSRLTPWIDRGYTRPAILTVSAAAGLLVIARELA